MRVASFSGIILVLFVCAFAATLPAPVADSFCFAILGDRTGSSVPGVYEEAWRQAAAEHPEFVITVGDTIEGGSDGRLGTEWQQAMQILRPYRALPAFFTAGNHDVWSKASAQAFAKYTKHPLRYSFDYRQAHFTVLDNSQSDEMPAAELAFLRRDLELHRQQPLKFILSHRPSWIVDAVLGNSQFPLHQIAKQYGVQYVIAGHIHQMLAFQIEGIHYLSMASSGGHLRASRRYEDGWFFEHSLIRVKGTSVQFKIEELAAPFGKGRISQPENWESAGLARLLAK